MKIKYYDHFSKQVIDVETSAKVAHQFTVSRIQREKERNARKSAGITVVSLDALIETGFQFASDFDVEKELARRAREKRYLNSPDYKRFRKSLRDEIRNVIDKMSPMVQKAMFLRFFKDLSISQIATLLNIAKGTAQEYISKGCGYIKYFLDADIAEQDKIEKEKRMKREQRKLNSLK